ncbi:MAG: glycosyltransferase [Helicobacter sp.]|nr:glycosyltransferase [Helicobacter sp.]
MHPPKWTNYIMLKHIVLLNDAQILTRPRPFRLFEMLKNDYKISIIQRAGNAQNPSCLTLEFDVPKSAKDRSKAENELLIKNCKEGNFNELIFTKNRAKIMDFWDIIEQQNGPISGIFVCDIVLLPFALLYKKSSQKNVKILIDLREFYPKQSLDPIWQESLGAFFSHLCKNYLKEIDFSISVSPKICSKYAEFGLKPRLFYSLPPRFSIRQNYAKKHFKNKKINIIYHGFLSRERNAQMLLKIAKLLPNTFHLYIMGQSNEKGLFENLQKSSKFHKNISFLEMVKMQEIIPFCARFDIGILTLSPNNFNHAHAIPNKFFEYFASKLVVVSTPQSALKELIYRYKIGKTSKHFSAHSLASAIIEIGNNLASYSRALDLAHQKLNLDANKRKMLGFLDQIFT